MKRVSILISLSITTLSVFSQNTMTPEALWQLGRVSPVGITKDGQQLIYRVSTPMLSENKSMVKTYIMPVAGGTAKEIQSLEGSLQDKHISPDGKYRIDVEEVKVQKIFGKDFYPSLEKSNVHIYESLNSRGRSRHWCAAEPAIDN